MGGGGTVWMYACVEGGRGYIRCGRGCEWGRMKIVIIIFVPINVS